MTKQGAIDYFVSRKENGERLLSNKCHDAEDWAIKALKVYPEWVSVKDKFPLVSDRYLICVTINSHNGTSRYVTSALYQETKKKFLLGKCEPYWEVTHWMEKPKPPEAN